MDFKDLEEWDALVGVIAPAGHWAGIGATAFERNISYTTYPEEWIDQYNAGGYAFADPSVLWAMAPGKTHIIRWSEIKVPDLRGVFPKAAEYHINFGMTVRFKHNSIHCAAAFARPDREYTDREMVEVEEHFRLFCIKHWPAEPLTKSELITTAYLLKGWSLHDISVKRGLGLQSVKNMTTSARKKIGARDNTELSLKAKTLGLLKGVKIDP